jgi:hypothetical protein
MQRGPAVQRHSNGSPHSLFSGHGRCSIRHCFIHTRHFACIPGSTASAEALCAGCTVAMASPEAGVARVFHQPARHGSSVVPTRTRLPPCSTLLSTRWSGTGTGASQQRCTASMTQSGWLKGARRDEMCLDCQSMFEAQVLFRRASGVLRQGVGLCWASGS